MKHREHSSRIKYYCSALHSVVAVADLRPFGGSYFCSLSSLKDGKIIARYDVTTPAKHIIPVAAVSIPFSKDT